MVTETSAESYDRIQEAGEMGKSQRVVFEYIRDNPGCSIKDIKEGTGLLQENVCGRKKELEDEGFIMKAGETINTETNRRVETWILTEGIQKEKQEEEEKPRCITEASMNKINKMVQNANNFQRNKIKEWCERWNQIN